MCGPLEIIGAAAGFAGGAMKGVAGYQQQKAMAAQSKANARVLRQQALLERDKTSHEARLYGKNARRLVAEQVAAASASGFLIDGSTSDFIEASAVERDLDLQAIRYGGRIEADRLQRQARQERLNSNSQSGAAGLAFMSPVIGSAVRLGRGFGAS